MVLEWIVRNANHPGSTTAVQRFFIDMPARSAKLCVIRQIHVWLEDWGNIRQFDIAFALSMDPDHTTPANLNFPDSRIPLMIRWARNEYTAVGFQVGEINPLVYHFPEGLVCPHGRLPFFIQNSNNAAVSNDYRLTIFFEFVKATQEEVAVAVMRRGRGVGRRVL